MKKRDPLPPLNPYRLGDLVKIKAGTGLFTYGSEPVPVYQSPSFLEVWEKVNEVNVGDLGIVIENKDMRPEAYDDEVCIAFHNGVVGWVEIYCIELVSPAREKL